MLARCAEQRLELQAKRSGKRRNIGLLADDAPGDQNAIGADAGFGGAQFGDGSKAGRQQVPDAIDLGAARQARRSGPRMGWLAPITWKRGNERRSRGRRVPISVPGAVDDRSRIPVPHSDPTTGK